MPSRDHSFLPKNNKRAIRRHHKWRKIQQARKSLFVQHMPMEVRFESARKIADHLKVCSCHYSCGNKRYDPWLSKKGRLTKQERIMLSIFQDFYRDWEDDNE